MLHLDAAVVKWIYNTKITIWRWSGSFLFNILWKRVGAIASVERIESGDRNRMWSLNYSSTAALGKKSL